MESQKEGFIARLLDSSISETAASSTYTEPSTNQLIAMNTLDGYSFVSRGTKLTDAILEDQFLSSNEIYGTDVDSSVDKANITHYEILEGDTLGGIAAAVGLSVDTLMSANGLTNANAIRIGMRLTIPPIDGIVYKVKKGESVSILAKRFQAEEASIISFNDLPKSGDLRVGDEIIIPGGKNPVNSRRNLASNKDTSSKRFALLPHLDSEFVVPATGIITQGVHGINGVDVAGKSGTPIYAAAAGVVGVAKVGGWNSGYGNYIRISHSNGAETLYAHLSKIVISQNTRVEQGELIGYMGNTGHSTGPHVHFEVRGGRNFLSNYRVGAKTIAGK